VAGRVPANCECIVSYTARRSWDFKPYLSHAEVRIERLGEQLGYATYHLEGGGGLALSKFDSTGEKMDPIIDELLAR
jgi:hypothetical protein